MSEFEIWLLVGLVVVGAIALIALVSAHEANRNAEARCSKYETERLSNQGWDTRRKLWALLDHLGLEIDEQPSRMTVGKKK